MKRLLAFLISFRSVCSHIPSCQGVIEHPANNSVSAINVVFCMVPEHKLVYVAYHAYDAVLYHAYDVVE